MSQNPQLLVPLAVFASLVLLTWIVFHFRLKRRELLHKERLAAIEKGIEIPQELLADSAALTPLACLLRSLIFLLTGAAFSIFMIAMAISEYERELYAVSTLGLLPMGIGVAYLVCYRKLAGSGNPAAR